MAKKKKLGHQTKVLVNATAVGFVLEFERNEVTRELTEVTDLESVAVENLDSDPPDYGSISITCAHDPEDTGDIAIETFYLNDDIDEREATIALKVPASRSGTAPSASTVTYTTITYTGRITSLKDSTVKSRDLLTRVIKMKLNAKPVKS